MGEGTVIRDLLRQAACGDRHAQGVLAAEAIGLTTRGECDITEGLATAEILARLTTSHPGSDSTDYIGLASVLMLRAIIAKGVGETDDADVLEAEAIQILDRVADTGDEYAAELLVQAGQVCSLRAWAMAREEADA